jgi:hypothetical protein
MFRWVQVLQCKASQGMEPLNLNLLNPPEPLPEHRRSTAAQHLNRLNPPIPLHGSGG